MLKVSLAKRFILLFSTMIIFTGGEGIFMLWSKNYIQLNFAGSAWEAGVSTGIFIGGMIISRITVGYFIPQDKFKYSIIGFSLFNFLITLGFPNIREL